MWHTMTQRRTVLLEIDMAGFVRFTHHMYTFPVFPCQISGALREMGMTFNAFGP